MSLRAKQVTAIAVSVVIAGVMVMLGIWQMHRFQLSVVDIAAQRAAQEPVELAPAVHADGSLDDIYGRTVTAAGEYLPKFQEVTGTTNARVVTAFKLDDGHVLAVVRGSVAEGDEPADAPSGRQEIRGVFLASDTQANRPTGTVRLQTLAQTWPSPLVAGYVTLDEQASAQQGLEPAKVQLPDQKGTSMHQGYALQWWVFAVAAIAFGVFLARQFAQQERQKRARALAQKRKREEIAAAVGEVANHRDTP